MCCVRRDKAIPVLRSGLRLRFAPHTVKTSGQSAVGHAADFAKTASEHVAKAAEEMKPAVEGEFSGLMAWFRPRRSVSVLSRPQFAFAHALGSHCR